MFLKDLLRWCEVDIRDDDSGLVHRGVIRDITSGRGFTVDFDYPDHHSVFIAYESCLVEKEQGHKSFKVGDLVYILFRSSPDRPWIWYPSTFLVGSSLYGACVEMDVAGQMVKEVVSYKRVRHQGAELEALSKYEFRRYCRSMVELPVGKGALSFDWAEQFLEKWAEQTDTKCVKLVDHEKRLVYVRYRTPPLTEVEAVSQIRHLKRRGQPAGSAQQLPDGIQEIFHLPLHLWSEILSVLRVSDMMVCRKVCSAWNVMITSLASETVNISLSARDCERPHLILLTLHRLVTSATKTLAFTGIDSFSGSENERHAVSLRISIDMLKGKRTVRPLIVISTAQLRLRTRSCFADDTIGIEGSYTDWGNVCNKFMIRSAEIWIGNVPYCFKMATIELKHF